MQAGRNDPCPCGSGRKYKKCCRPQSEDTARLRTLVSPGIDTLVERFNAQRYDAMEEGARALLAHEPQSGAAWKMLGIALARQGKNSLPAAERAAALLPADADAHNNFGLALQAAGQHARAVPAFRRALLLEPRFAEAALNLAATLQAQGEFAAAAECCRRAIGLRPDFAAAHHNLGLALGELERLTEAIASYERAIALRPDLVEAHCNLGILARLAGDASRAGEACRVALSLDPQRVPAILLQASLSADAGDFAAALAACARALELDPQSAEALAAIPAYRRMTPADTGWAQRAQELTARGLAPRREALLQFALGKYHDDTAAYGAAFASYRRANTLAGSLGPRYDAAAMEDFVTRLMQLDVAPTGGAPAAAALIVGMPRSGTSLAEQILASHRQAHGAGELPFWRDWWAGRPRAAPAPARSELAQAAGQYLALLGTRASQAAVGIDKMPYNFLYLGLIAAALPGIRIIHLQRDPRDTGLSIYFQDFSAGQAYATDPDAIAHYYRQYLRIMDHWRRVLPSGALLEVRYEALVADPPAWSRRMVEFLGLEWDPDCLDFQGTARAVTTASQWQVRQRIHSGSVGRWRHYEPYLGALGALQAEINPGAG